VFPDHAGSGIQPDPDVQRPVCSTILVRLVLELLIELVRASKHFQRGLAGVDLLLRIVERCVPERHDRVADVADVFVDRAIALDDGVRQRSQKTIHQPRQTLWIVLVDSEIVVNPRTSLNKTVTLRSSPPSTSFSGERASCSTSVSRGRR
jgi:hypothetical protein